MPNSEFYFPQFVEKRPISANVKLQIIPHVHRTDICEDWHSHRKHRRSAELHKSLKRECIRLLTPLTREDARRLIQSYVDEYNGVRLHSALGYVTPQDMLAGRQAEIHASRDRKLEAARQQRQLRRQQQSSSRLLHWPNLGNTMGLPGETEAGTAGMQPC